MPGSGLLPSRRRFLGTAALAGCGLVVGCPARPEPVTLALVPWPPNELYHLAERLGYYDGLPLRLIDLASAEQGLQAFRNGVAALCPTTLDEALLLAADQPDVRAVQVLSSSAGGDAVIAQPELATMADLRGRRVGYEASGLGAYVLGRALELAGLALSDVVAVHLQVDEHERGFLERRVDAVVTYEPVLTRLVAAGGRVVFDSRAIPGEIVDVLVTRAELVQSRPELIAAVVDGWLRAAAHLRARPEDAAGHLAQRLGVPAGGVAGAFAGVHLLDLAENVRLLDGELPALLPTAERLGQRMLAQRLLPRAPSPSALLEGSIVARLARR